MPFCLLARNPSPGSCSPISLQLLARHSSSPGFHRTNQSTFQIFCCLYESTADSWSFPANLHDKRLLSRDKQSTISSTSIQLFAFLLLFNLLLQITWHCNKNPCNFVANKKKQRTIQNNLPQSCSQLGNMKSIKIRHSIVILMKRRVFFASKMNVWNKFEYNRSRASMTECFWAKIPWMWKLSQPPDGSMAV